MCLFVGVDNLDGICECVGDEGCWRVVCWLPYYRTTAPCTGPTIFDQATPQRDTVEVRRTDKSANNMLCVVRPHVGQGRDVAHIGWRKMVLVTQALQVGEKC